MTAAVATFPAAGTAAQPVRTYTADSFNNIAAKVGLQTGNQQSSSVYLTNYTSRNRAMLENAYRSSWICGSVVNAVADDMTREGIAITGNTPPDRVERMERRATELNVWPSMGSLARWGRLHGGAIGWLMIAGQDPSTPLDVSRIPRGGFMGIKPLDRWVCFPVLGKLVTDMGPDYGLPEFYEVVQQPGLPGMIVHYSRVIRYIGAELPYYQAQYELLWGQSELERVWDRIISYDSATLGTAQLVYKAHLRTVQMEGLREAAAMGGKAWEGVQAQIKAMGAFQSNEGISLLDTKDVFTAHSYTFAGLDKVMMEFSGQLSGASGIPITRLFGQAPAGMNATGESDMRNYYDTVKQAQEVKLRRGVALVYACLHVSEFGTLPDASFDFTFRNLWQMTSMERAEVATKTTDSVTKAFDDGLISAQTALKELKQSSAETGVFTNISDEEIAAADVEPAPEPSPLDLIKAKAELAPATDPTGQPTGTTDSLYARTVARLRRWRAP